MNYIGVDGTSDGWFAVMYSEDGYEDAKFYPTGEEEDGFEGLWEDHQDAELILVDVPIGLYEERGDKRPCDDEARDMLGHPRSSSVFAVPVRAAVQPDNYEDAKKAQENKTDGSLGMQSWAICDKIQELDDFMTEEADDRRADKVRESHPEVCFWGLNDGDAMQHSKTGQPAQAFWERVKVIRQASENNDLLGHIEDAVDSVDGELTNDDVIDAFALAVTAKLVDERGEQVLGESEPDEELDPKGLPMEMVYVENPSN